MPCFHALAARSWDGVIPITLRKRLLKWLAELNPQASAMSVSGIALCCTRFFAFSMRRCITY